MKASEWSQVCHVSRVLFSVSGSPLTWQPGPWSLCSKTCGGGVQYRQVASVMSELKIIDNYWPGRLCDAVLGEEQHPGRPSGVLSVGPQVPEAGREKEVGSSGPLVNNWQLLELCDPGAGSSSASPGSRVPGPSAPSLSVWRGTQVTRGKKNGNIMQSVKQWVKCTRCQDDNWFCLEFCWLSFVSTRRWQTAYQWVFYSPIPSFVPCAIRVCPVRWVRFCVTLAMFRVRSEDEDGAVHPGPEERGGGRPLPGAGGGEAARLSALPQHGVRRGLGHRGVVSGQPKLLDRSLTR